MIETIAMSVGLAACLVAFIFWNNNSYLNKFIKGMYLLATIFFGYLLLKGIGL